ARTEIMVQHPSEERLLLRLVFDDKHRLLEREAILTRSSTAMTLDRDEPSICSRHEFSQYRPYDDGQGNTIWFPSPAVLRYFLGCLPDGSPVQSYAIQVSIADIEFNSEIPAEKFTLKTPDEVPVFDRRQDRYGTVSLSY